MIFDLQQQQWMNAVVCLTTAYSRSQEQTNMMQFALVEVSWPIKKTYIVDKLNIFIEQN